MKKLIIPFILCLNFYHASAQIPLDDSYAIEFHRLYFNDAPGRFDAEDAYLKKIKDNKDLLKDVDQTIYAYEGRERLTLDNQLKITIKAEFVGFYAYLTFSKTDIADYFNRPVLTDQAIATNGFKALGQYLSMLMHGSKPMLKKLWIAQLDLNAEKFYAYLAKTNVDRKTGKPGFPLPGQFNATYWENSFSLVHPYAYLDIASDPDSGSIFIDHKPKEDKPTHVVLVVPIKTSPTMMVVDIEVSGFKPATYTVKVADQETTKIFAKLKKL